MTEQRELWLQELMDGSEGFMNEMTMMSRQSRREIPEHTKKIINEYNTKIPSTQEIKEMMRGFNTDPGNRMLSSQSGRQVKIKAEFNKKID